MVLEDTLFHKEALLFPNLVIHSCSYSQLWWSIPDIREWRLRNIFPIFGNWDWNKILHPQHLRKRTKIVFLTFGNAYGEPMRTSRERTPHEEWCAWLVASEEFKISQRLLLRYWRLCPRSGWQKVMLKKWQSKETFATTKCIQPWTLSWGGCRF